MRGVVAETSKGGGLVDPTPAGFSLFKTCRILILAGPDPQLLS